MRFSTLFLIGILIILKVNGQEKQELERRIAREDFPQKALAAMDPYLDDAKRVKYYEESDGEKMSYEIKLKKGKLRYSIEFDPKGKLEDVEIRIKEVDIPSASLAAIEKDLKHRLDRYKIRKIQQQYVHSESREVSQTLREAFQNLLLPDIRYELIVGGKQSKEYQTFEILYDANGSFITQRIVKSSDKRYVLYE